MNLKGLGISNYRSFNEKGIFLDNLNKINIIIGKNNSGKSNILRFLHTLNKNLNNLTTFPKDIKNQHKRNGLPTSLFLKIKGDEFGLNNKKIARIDTFDYKKFKDSYYKIEYLINELKVKELPEFFDSLKIHQLSRFHDSNSGGDVSYLKQLILAKWKNITYQKINSIFSNIIYIPHLRVIKEGHKYGDSNSSIDGSNIISKMFEMQNPTIGKESDRNKFLKIQKFVGNLINKPELLIEIPHNKAEIVLTFDGNRLPLESYGTGIHQLVLLCSTLVIHDNSIVCIEEPEIHLHPELQRKFLNFLLETDNYYFITTHSNIFLDNLEKTSVYHMVNDGVFSSISHMKRDEDTISILEDLGYHASDLLQSNGVIWVEGPSDRTYLLRWINLIDSSLIEGLHYVIMFYGGRLLSHLSFEFEEVENNLIPLLRLNRNAFVIMDRDGFTNQTKINSTKTRINKEIGNKNSWITKGREIENYLTENSLNSWLGSDSIKIEQNTKIEDLISSVSSKKYDKLKSKYSREIINHICEEDLDILDLRSKIKLIVKNIRLWNSFETQ